MALDDGWVSSTCVLLLTARPLHKLLICRLLCERPGPQQLDHVVPGFFLACSFECSVQRYQELNVECSASTAAN